MGFLSLFVLLVGGEPTESLGKQMFPVYLKEASDYTMTVETFPEKPLELQKEPVFEWSNPIRSDGVQQGVIFLWLRDGRPAVLCSVFSEPVGAQRGRRVIHEFHALDREKLVIRRPKGYNQWEPRVGLARTVMPDAGVPAATRGARLLQMRRLARQFSGHSIDDTGKRLELRLLGTPLYRYPDNESNVVDGALFTLVSTAGTDPEVLLLIEAREEGDKLRWEYACGRFSDRSLYVERKGEQVWSSIRDENNTFLHGPKHLFRVYADKIVDLDGKVLAHLRATEKIFWGEVVSDGQQ